MLKVLSLSAAVILSASIAAQAVETIPAGYATLEGLRSRHVPLRYVPSRIQCGYGPKATGWTGVRVIKELWARADGTAHLAAAFKVDAQVLLSSDGADPECCSYIFRNNHGKDVRVFIKKRTFNYPAFVAGPSPAPWSIQLKGDAPFVATKPTLVVDWATYGANQANVNFYVDACNLTKTYTGTAGTITYYGTACNPTTFYNYVLNPNEGDCLVTYGYTRNPKDIVMTWLGVGQTSIDIGGGCTVLTLPIFMSAPVISQASSTGWSQVEFGKLPVGTKGMKLHTQMVAFDSSYAIRLSRGTEITIGDRKEILPGFMCSHRYGYSSSALNPFDPDTDPARYGWRGTAIIFRNK